VLVLLVVAMEALVAANTERWSLAVATDASMIIARITRGQIRVDIVLANPVTILAVITGHQYGQSGIWCYWMMRLCGLWGGPAGGRRLRGRCFLKGGLRGPLSRLT
jgi:hypothetical protein